MQLRLLFFLSFPAFVFATSYQGEIFTWGYGELLKDILEAIRALVDNNGLGAIFKSAMGIAFLLFAFKKATDGRSNIAWEFGKMMLLATAIWYLFLTAPNDTKHRYVITDRVTGANYVVEQVPTGIGEALSLISNLEDKIANAMEKYFSLPNSITYRNSGFGFPLQVQSIMPEIKSSNPYFVRTFKEFIENCTLYEVQDGSKDIQLLLTANDLLTALDPNGDNRLTKVYSNANPDGQVVSCDSAYDVIVNEVQNKEVVNAENLAAALAHTTTTLLEQRIPDVAQLFFNAATSAKEYLQQNFLVNMTKSAFSSIAAATGLSASQLAYSAAVAQQSANDKFITAGFLAKDYLPLAKGILTALIVALSWIMALLAVMFSDYKYITKYFFLLFWLMLWTPILVIINYVGDIYVAKVFNNIVTSSGQMITLFTSSFINNKTSSALAWLGYLVWTTPLLAYSIAKASEYGFVSFVSSLSSMAGSAASAGAGADLKNAQTPAPQIRVGDVNYTDKFGTIEKYSYAYAYGDQYEVKSALSKDGVNSVSARAAGTGTTASATFDGFGNLLGTMFKAQNYAANISSAYQSKVQNAYESAKQQTMALQERLSTSLSAGISEALQENKQVSVDTSHVTSMQDRKEISQAIATAASNVFAHNEDFKKNYEKLEALKTEGALGVGIKKTGAGYQISFTGKKGEGFSINTSARETEEFVKRFSTGISSSFATSDTFSESFKQAIGSSNNKYFSQTAQISKDLSSAYSEMESAKETLSYLKSNGINVSSNALNMLFEDEVKIAKEKGLGDKEAVEYAISKIDDYAHNGKLMDVLEKGGYLNSVIYGKEAVNKASQDITESVDKKFNENSNFSKKVNDMLSHTHEEVRGVNGITSSKVANAGEEFKSKAYQKAHEIGEFQHNLKTQQAQVNFKKDSVKQDVDEKVNNSLLNNYLQDYKSQAMLAGGAMIASVPLARGSRAGRVSNIEGNIRNLNPSAETSITRGGSASPAQAGARSVAAEASAAETAAMAGRIISKVAAGAAGLAIPFPIGGDKKEYLNKFEGYKKDNDIFTPNEVELVFAGKGRYDDETYHPIKKTIETDVNYKEWSNYVEAHKSHMQEVFNALKEKNINLTEADIQNIKEAKTPQELDSVLTTLANSETSSSAQRIYNSGLWNGKEVSREFKEKLHNPKYHPDFKISVYNSTNDTVPKQTIDTNAFKVSPSLTGNALSKDLKQTPHHDNRTNTDTNTNAMHYNTAESGLNFSSTGLSSYNKTAAPKQKTSKTDTQSQETQEHQEQTTLSSKVSHLSGNRQPEILADNDYNYFKKKEKEKGNADSVSHSHKTSSPSPKEFEVAKENVNKAHSDINELHRKAFRGAEGWLGNQANKNLYPEGVREVIRKYNKNPSSFIK